LNSFEALYRRLGLSYTERVKAVIKAHSHLSKTEGADDGPDSVRRDSKATMWNWKARLSKEEIQRIRGKVEDISGPFYSEEDW
jgi:hypothetical protein